MGTKPCDSNTPLRVSNIHCLRAMALGPKSRVPFGIDGLLMGHKNRPYRSALEAPAILNEQRHNQHRGQNPNHLHGANIQTNSLAPNATFAA